MQDYQPTTCRRCGALVYYPDELRRVGCAACESVRLSIRSTAWRGVSGFTVTGRDGVRSVSIFTLSRTSAEVIRRKILRGDELIAADFEPAT